MLKHFGNFRALDENNWSKIFKHVIRFHAVKLDLTFERIKQWSFVTLLGMCLEVFNNLWFKHDSLFLVCSVVEKNNIHSNREQLKKNIISNYVEMVIKIQINHQVNRKTYIVDNICMFKTKFHLKCVLFQKKIKSKILNQFIYICLFIWKRFYYEKTSTRSEKIVNLLLFALKF